MGYQHFRLITSDGAELVTADNKGFYTADAEYIADDERLHNYRVYAELYPSSATKSTLLEEGGFIALLEILDNSEIIHEPKGEFSCTLHIPLDENGKWKLLQNGWYVKIPMKYHDEMKPQIFIVTSHCKEMNDSGVCELTVEAEHISYALRGVTLPRTGALTAAQRVLTSSALGSVISFIRTTVDFADVNYNTEVLAAKQAILDDFTITTEIPAGEPPIIVPEGVNFIDFLFNSYAEKYNAKVYRDNFTVTVCRTMPDQKSAGVIRYGQNLTEIDCEIDSSEVYSYVIAESNTNAVTAVAYKNGNYPYAYPRIKNIIVTFDEDVISELSGDVLDEVYRRLEADAEAWANYHFRESVSLQVRFEDIEYNAMYSQFVGLRQHDAGDLVSVYHTDFDILYKDLEIIRTEYNICRQKITAVEIGEFRSSITRSDNTFSNITEV
ncbi:MAG: phage tail protein [Ruminococcus sp.]|nr:phage tail protein [Ruminococcus sp.]